MFDFIKENVFSIWFLIFLVYVVLKETFQRLYSNTLNKIRVVNGKYNADYDILYIFTVSYNADTSHNFYIYFWNI